MLPSRIAYPIVRWKNVLTTLAIYGFSRRRPAAMRRLIRAQLARRLPAGFDIDTHFNPRYDPWDQRMCLIPDGDLFEAIGGGRVSVVTDHIESLTETGLALASGTQLEADLIVTATGLSLVPLGGMRLSVDGSDVDAGRRAHLPRDAAQRRAEHGVRVRLLEPVVDARRRPHLRARLPAARAHGPPRLPRLHAGNRDGAITPCRSPTSPRATCCGRSTSSPSRARETPWQREQNYARNLRSMQRAPLDDPALEFAA